MAYTCHCKHCGRLIGFAARLGAEEAEVPAAHRRTVHPDVVLSMKRLLKSLSGAKNCARIFTGSTG